MHINVSTPHAMDECFGDAPKKHGTACPKCFETRSLKTNICDNCN